MNVTLIAMSKKEVLAVAFILVLVISLLLNNAMASTVQLSVPEFTLKFVDASHNETYTDPYTGAKTTYLVQNRTIEIRIKNQPFTPFTNSSGNYIGLYYNIRSKGHFSEYWMERNGGSDNYLQQNYGSEYTVVPFYGDIPSSGQVEFQVEAIAGYNYEVVFAISGWVITGQESGWSNTQIMSFPDGSVTMSTSPNPTSSSAPSPDPTDSFSPIPTPALSPASSPQVTPSPFATSEANSASSSATPENTSATQEQTGFLNTSIPLEYCYAIVAVLVIIVVAGLSLVYLKKVKQKSVLL
jgi:hypothetical protein